MAGRRRGGIVGSRMGISMGIGIDGCTLDLWDWDWVDDWKLGLGVVCIMYWNR